MEKEEVVLFWFRRDLRLEDNRGLAAALRSGSKVLPIFIFDSGILDKLAEKKDQRVDYIHQALQQLQKELQQEGSDIRTFYGKPLEIFKELTAKFSVKTVYCNRDYEPSAITRDNKIAEWLEKQDIGFVSEKDQVIFESDEILKGDGTPYSVYTPYSRKWREKLTDKDYRAAAMPLGNLFSFKKKPIMKLQDIGFEKTAYRFETPTLDRGIIDNYGEHRDYPAKDHTTRLGVALRFGTISIRKCVKFALAHNATWLSELIWREFFMQILYHYPQVVQHCFKPQYEHIAWRNNEKEFAHWCAGTTGYPLVDAGMRELNETGFMHNRVRMVVASFLTKHLLIDWRWGEAYFAEKLLDYELSSNNGNWQWAAGCGCDAAPYFRIFNPAEQIKKFDKALDYVKRWNPDFESLEQQPIVEHRFARERALEVYKKALDKSKH
ncbi:deoxyribodipyrimidine photo-lyase [Sphingobacterium oryzagri]|uniref:Deoxyribodipyrimidine photo-lyase n=1 Tax=Sphingobacterium oryzagri TaxID=3025669 RepID=A0ABY7WKD0_9SPHI|nr:deoxyribodipyrimidine photo-lyase [Sphingobacterium sp. KACC 22765]WDF70039.1 deoxyribodipyrimidine photo-lyase [Sphingobacterium sp. KACC 22765]